MIFKIDKNEENKTQKLISELNKLMKMEEINLFLKDDKFEKKKTKKNINLDFTFFDNQNFRSPEKPESSSGSFINSFNKCFSSNKKIIISEFENLIKKKTYF